MSATTLAAAARRLIGSTDEAAGATDGAFIDCRRHWKGRIGRFAMSLAKHAGGAIAVGHDGPDRDEGLAHVALRLAARVRLDCRCDAAAPDHGRTVLLRQENDPAPKFSFLEEGPVRVGMRVAFDLLDDAGHYLADGHLDAWLYREGDLHVSFAVETIDRLGHGPVRDCWVEVTAEGCQEVRAGEVRVAERERVELTCASGSALEPSPSGGGQGEGSLLRHRQGSQSPHPSPLPDKGEGVGAPALRSRSLIFARDALPAALYWLRDQGEPWQYACDHGRVPPFYASRWPTGMQQWCHRHMGFACDSGGAITAAVERGTARVELAWLRGAAVEGDVTRAASLIVSLAETHDDLARRVAAVQNPLTPEVIGGTFRCYTEEDGLYEVGQTDPTRVEIVFPPDELERTVRVRHYRRKTDPLHRGGVVATANGRPLRAQLVSEGGLTDDVCVVIEMAHRSGPADDVIVATRLDAREPTRVVIEKVPGIQAAYQSEITGVDLQRRWGNRRDVVVWSSRCREKPLLELDLFSCALHRVTAAGKVEPALWEVPLAWFRSCGISKHHYCNDLKAFRVERNGPDAVELYARGTNASGRAQSEVWLRVPYDHPRLRLEVRMRMEALEGWDQPSAEFSDIFPYPSRLPETWFHEAVLFVQAGRSWLHYTRRPDLNVRPPERRDGDGEDRRLFYALYPTDRGNVLTLVRRVVAPPGEPLQSAVCGNYIDVHVNLRPAAVPVPKGTVYEAEYVTELYGDRHTSVDELKQIGLRSLEAGDVVV